MARIPVPVRDPEREKRAAVPGEVKTYKMSPEELEDYRARTGYKMPTNSEGQAIKQPVLDGSARPATDAAKTDANKTTASEPDKQEFLRQRAGGASITAIEKAFGLKPNGLYYWIKKWGWTGMTPEKASELLNGTEQLDKKEEAPENEIDYRDRRIARLNDDLQLVNKRNSELERAVADLELERDALLQTVERAIDAPAHELLGFEAIGREIGALVNEKNAAYGDSFAKCGEFLRLLYPAGIRPEQYIDALCLVRIFDKQMRIATKKDAFGESPYRDIVGYGLLGVAMDEAVSYADQ